MSNGNSPWYPTAIYLGVVLMTGTASFLSATTPITIIAAGVFLLPLVQAGDDLPGLLLVCIAGIAVGIGAISYARGGTIALFYLGNLFVGCVAVSAVETGAEQLPDSVPALTGLNFIGLLITGIGSLYIVTGGRFLPTIFGQFRDASGIQFSVGLITILTLFYLLLRLGQEYLIAVNPVGGRIRHLRHITVKHYVSVLLAIAIAGVTGWIIPFQRLLLSAGGQPLMELVLAGNTTRQTLWMLIGVIGGVQLLLGLTRYLLRNDLPVLRTLGKVAVVASSGGGSLYFTQQVPQPLYAFALSFALLTMGSIGIQLLYWSSGDEGTGIYRLLFLYIIVCSGGAGGLLLAGVNPLVALFYFSSGIISWQACHGIIELQQLETHIQYSLPLDVIGKQYGIVIILTTLLATLSMSGYILRGLIPTVVGGSLAGLFALLICYLLLYGQLSAS